MREDDVVRLRHMLEAAHEAVGFAQGRPRADLNSDRKLVLALVKAIEIIGEAAYQIPQTARDEAPDIPWEDIIGMRHRLVHALGGRATDNLEKMKRPPPICRSWCFTPQGMTTIWPSGCSVGAPRDIYPGPAVPTSWSPPSTRSPAEENTSATASRKNWPSKWISTPQNPFITDSRIANAR